jgi:site-specific recombinase XerD
MKITANFSALLEAFFTDRLMHQRNASPHTIAAYRDTFRLLLYYAQEQLKTAPSALTLENLNAPFIGAFLNHLEKQRGNSARSRNLRLAAIHSFFRYAAFEHPEHSALIQRVLAIPSKRYERALVDFLSLPEVDALLATPDRRKWSGRRDHAIIALAVQTGLRVSELVGLCCKDIVLDTGPHVRCDGKGRKERCTPLTKQTVAIMRAWLREQNGQPVDPLFPNARGGRLSTDGIQYLLSKHAAGAQQKCPSLRKKRITPHVLRHTTAMNLLLAGVDRSVIALWLGHESVETTQIYIDANLALKEKILEKTALPKTTARRYRPDDQVLTFLRNL